MWFGTDDGLNKFDGYRFQVYRHKKNDSTTLSHNVIRALLQDKTGLIWIGTSDGLNVYNPLTDRFTVFRSSPADPKSLRSNEISCLAEDTNGSIWIGTRDGVIDKYDRRSNTFIHIPNVDEKTHPLEVKPLRAMYFDRFGVLWAGTMNGGLRRYNPSSNTFTPFIHRANDNGSLPDNNILSIYEDRKGRLWIGTRGSELCLFDRASGTCRQYSRAVAAQHENLDSVTVLTIGEDHSGKIIYGTFGGGLKFLDPETGEVTAWRANIADRYSLAGDQVMAFYRDPLDNLWIGTYTGGVSKYDPLGEPFQIYRNENPHYSLLTDNNVRALYRDAQGRIWVGTAKGLTILNPKTGISETYGNDPRNSNSLTENYVSAIYEDHQGTMWIGTRKGLHSFDRRTKRFTRYLENPGDPYGLNNAFIRQVLETKAGVLWIATMGGLHSFDRKSKRFTRYIHDEKDSLSISNNNIRSLYEDKAGILWIGTYGGGFNRFDPATGTFRRFVHDPKNPNSVSGDLAAPITGDNDGNIWIGTYGQGINKYDPKTGEFTTITESDGLCNNTIYGIQMCRDGDLWITTNAGMSRYTPSTRQFKTYSAASGLQGDEFNLNSSFKDQDGTMYFGGQNGFNVFHPEKIYENTVVPPVVITSLHIFNKPLVSDTSITIRKLITLPYNENSLTFDFVALNYRKTELNQYRYLLEGFDKEWSPAGLLRHASYTNLPPGTYTFRVQASNNDGVWNSEGAAISIIIKPPFWATWWAYSLYVISLGGVFLTILLYAQRRQRRRLMMEQQQHEAELVRQKNIKLKEANDEILRHQEILRERSDQIEWTNKELKDEIIERHRAEDRLKAALAEKEVLLKEIHHRVKNNLTIVGSLLGMQSDFVENESDRQLFHEAKNRVITMAQIHERLYQSKNLADIEFGEYMRGVATQLFHAYNNGNASLRISAEKVKFGVDMAIPCGLIINELITNSLKYAFPEGSQGMVFVEVRSMPDNEYEVIVGDTGIGFSPAIDFRSTETMGMMLVRSLVKQLKGTIELDSNRGTKFTIRFPFAKEEKAA